MHRGARIAILPPEFHADRYRGMNVFCYRNYGADIADRVRRAGVADLAFCRPNLHLFGHARTVVVARRRA